MTRQQLSTTIASSALVALVLAFLAAPAAADQVILDDLIVDGSACIGLDCVNGESFGFDTLRLKENNLRIKFDDTSTSASFPRNDWQLTANESSNGGAEKFSIDDISGGRTPFTIEAGAPSHSLYVDDGGRIGFGTSVPVVELHVVDGDTPTLRLEQDGSSGFQAQTWDVAGNETNFFIRDVTNGSKLPFRIRPNAPTSSVDIEGATGDVGVGTTSPDASIHVRRTNGNASILVEEASTTKAVRELLELENNGPTGLRLVDTEGGGASWVIRSSGSTGQDFVWNNLGANGVNEMILRENGNLEILGVYKSNGVTLNVPDYVFESEYPLMSLSSLSEFVSKNKHLPNIPSAAEIRRDGVNLNELQMKMLEKIEELTLYILTQQDQLVYLQAESELLQARLQELESGLAD